MLDKYSPYRIFVNKLNPTISLVRSIDGFWWLEAVSQWFNKNKYPGKNLVLAGVEKISGELESVSSDYYDQSFKDLLEETIASFLVNGVDSDPSIVWGEGLNVLQGIDINKQNPLKEALDVSYSKNTNKFVISGRFGSILSSMSVGDSTNNDQVKYAELFGVYIQLPNVVKSLNDWQKVNISISEVKIISEDHSMISLELPEKSTNSPAIAFLGLNYFDAYWKVLSSKGNLGCIKVFNEKK